MYSGLLCLLFGLTLADPAQDGLTGSPEDNACNAGGSLEGKCDWPTEAEDQWAWTCGWYIARVDTGEFTVNDVPAWCNYFVAPQIVCYDSSLSGQLDFVLTGALDTVSNAQGYASVDGSCSGGPFGVAETLVTAANGTAATDKCTLLLGAGYTGVHMNGLGYNTPASWYGCRITSA